MRKYIIAGVIMAVGILGLTVGPSVAGSLIGSPGIRDNSVRSVDLHDAGDGSVGVRLKDTSPWMQSRLQTRDLPSGLASGDEDAVIPLPSSEPRRTTVGSIDLPSGNYVVVANATVSSVTDNDNLLCYLGTASQPDASVANARALRESFTLTALVSGGESVTLDCKANDGGTATDVSLTAVEVR